MAGERADLTVRRAPLDDLERLVTLMRAAFGISVAESHFVWKYLENPSGPAVAFEAIGPDGPVAFYALLPETYLVGGKRTRAYQSVDNMIHPDYRGRGLYRLISVRAYEHILAEEGRYTVISFPSEKLRAFATAQFEWRALYTISLAFLPRTLHRANRFRVRTKGLTFTGVERAVEFVPYLSIRPGTSRAISVDLSPEFVQWRGFDHPFAAARGCLAWRGAEPVGMCLFSTEPGGRCLIRFAEFASPDIYREAVGSLAEYLFETTGASLLYTWEPVDEDRRMALRRIGFLKNPLGRGPGSSRFSFVTRCEPPEVNGFDWMGSTFDVQPIMHD